jgi:hypothetical protein
MFNVIWEVTDPQGELPDTVSVSTTGPVCAGAGVYVGFNVVALVSTPGPGAVHRIELKNCAVASVTMKGTPWQVNEFGPALAIGALLMVRIIKLLAFAQGGLDVTVMVSITVPPSISDVLGV